MELQQVQDSWNQGYQIVDDCIFIITTKDTRYYYTKCLDKSGYFNKSIYLLIKQAKSGSQTIIKIPSKNLKFTIDDKQIFKNSFDGTEINIIKRLDIKDNTTIVINFIDSLKQVPWNISFQTKLITTKWYHLIIKNKSDYQKILNQKSALHSTNKNQILDKSEKSNYLQFRQVFLDCKNEKYCYLPELNQLLIDLVTIHFQRNFVNLLCQTNLDPKTKQTSIKQQLHNLNEHAKSIGKMINNQFQQTIQKSDLQKQLISSQIQTSKAQSERYLEEIKQLKEKVNKLVQSNNKSIEDLKLRDDKIGLLQNQLYQTKQQSISLLSKCQQQSLSIVNITYQNSTKQTQLQLLKAEINKMKEQLLKNQRQIKQLQLQSLFSSDILNLYSAYKQYLKQILQKLQNRRIAGSKLLFRFDELNKANFHRYIDNHPHLLIVIHLCNGIHLAAYISDPIYPKMQQISEKSCIISLTRMETYCLDPSKKIFRYDEYFINFGNSELQLKSQQKKLFSNFGIQNSCYQHSGRDINFLLNEGKSKECQISEYEIFEICFSEDKQIAQKK